MYTQLTHLLHKFVYAVQETLQHLADTLETYPLQSPAAFHGDQRVARIISILASLVI